MKFQRPFRSALLLLGLPSVGAVGTKANPLSEVLKLIDSLAMKITQEGEEEAKAYKAFVSWCKDVTTNKGFAIKTAEAKKAKLEATIGKTSGDAQSSASKIEELAGNIAADDSDLKKATTMREKEVKDFVAKEAEMKDVVDTLGRAITVLEREMAKNPASFAQAGATRGFDGLVKTLNVLVDAAALSTADKQKLLSLVQGQQNSEDEDLGAPAPDAYKSHGGGILDVLEDLKEKAEEELGSLRKAEINSKHNFEMLKQGLEDEITAATGDLDEEKASKAASLEAKATAEGDLAETVKDLADGKATLKFASSNCMQSAADHEATVKSRNEELQAIAEAKKILQNTTGGATSQTYSFLQFGHGSSLQTRADLVHAEVVAAVKRLAFKHHSAALSQLASRISAILRFGTADGADPFAKVKELISGLISKLEAESTSEANEKAYCDEQLADTAEKKGELERKSSKLSSKIDQAAAKSASLKEAVKELQAELLALSKQQAEMDAARQEQRAAYAKSKIDLEAGLEGVRKAMSVLREYYGNDSGAAMLQAMTEQPAMPKKHVKAGGAGSSIIGILEVVESDFAKGLAVSTTQEDDAEAAYEQMTQENKVTKAIKDQDVKANTKEIGTLDKSIAELTTDRDTVFAELSAVNEYNDKLKGRCIAKPETYETRKARRQAEIQGLKDALAILEDETALMQRGKHGSRGRFLAVRRH